MRVGRAIGKDESEVAQELMAQLKARGHPDAPPAIATDGQGSYREAMVETWGRVPAYPGRGRPPTRKRAQPDWHYLQVVKRRSGSRLTGITIKVVYGAPEEVCKLLGEHTSYVERTNLTSRHMNGRLVRKNPFLLQGTAHASGLLYVGGLGLQPDPSHQDLAARS